MVLDFFVIAVYLLAINIIGITSAKVSSLDDYFLGGRSIPWPIVCLSIVATETSSLTFISIPGLAYISDLGFLQVALGFIVGRVLVALTLIPRYFSGNLETAYEFLQNRFGLSSRRVVAIIFHITRLLGDGIRLFATAIPLSLLLGFESFWPSILIIGLATFVYTLYGGIRSVALTDAVQLFVYVVSALAGLWIISDILGLPILSVLKSVPDEKFAILSTGFENGWRGLFGSYNIFSGLIGGAFLSFASHGTDHLIVQRLLTCRNEIAARKAVIFSGLIVFLQFALFLLLGLFIFLLMKGRGFEQPDTIMPYFVIHYLPPGIKGLMLAGILAAAMSTISSSINSLSSSTVMDILMISRKPVPEKQKIRISRLVAFMWSCVMIGVAMLFENTKHPLVEIALNIASITYGGMLGIFLLGSFFRKLNEKASISSMMLSVLTTAIIYLNFDLWWPWFVPVGFAISFFCGILFDRVFRLWPLRSET